MAVTRIPLLRFDDGETLDRVLGLDMSGVHTVCGQLGAVVLGLGDDLVAGLVEEDGWLPFENWWWWHLTNPCREESEARTLDLWRKLLGTAHSLGMASRSVGRTRRVLESAFGPLLRPLFVEDEWVQIHEAPFPFRADVQDWRSLMAPGQFEDFIRKSLPQAIVAGSYRVAGKLDIRVDLLPSLVLLLSYAGPGTEQYLNASGWSSETWEIRDTSHHVQGVGKTLQEALEKTLRKQSIHPRSTKEQWWAQNGQPCELCGPLASSIEACQLMDVPNPAMWLDDQLREALP
jgi:hypothetical protein